MLQATPAAAAAPAAHAPAPIRRRALPLFLSVAAAAALLVSGMPGLLPAVWAHPPQYHKARLIAFDRPLPAPVFNLAGLDGRKLSLADLRGHTVLLNFWATWCPPCVHEMPSLQRLSKAMKGRRFLVLAVALDMEGADKVAPFVKKLGLTFPVLVDPSGDVGETYGARDLPTTFVLDTQGRVVAAAKGAQEWDAPNVVDYLRELVAQAETPAAK